MAAAATEPPQPVAPLFVAEGDTVVFDINGDRQALIKVDARSKVKVGGAYCSATPLVGCPYGAMFTLGADGKSLERTEYTPLKDWDLPEAAQPGFNTRTNADLEARGDQALSTADIEAMKAEGRAGEEIVAALTAGSATFAAKTEFSQAKYRKKKAKKYIQVATLRRPTAATVAEAYFSSSPAKTGYLRADALALLLSLANVGAHAHVLVVETCGGLVSAAALERAGSAPGAGAGVASAWVGGGSARRPSLDIWRSFNFPAAQRAALRFAPLSELLAETRQDAEQQGAAAAAMEQQRLQAQVAAAATQQQEVAVAAAGEEAEAMQEDEGQPAAQQEAQQQQQQQQLAEDIAAAANTATAPAAAAAAPASEAGGEGGKADGGAAAAPPPVRAPFNSCILTASSVSPLALIQHVLPLLAPSASLAVYCQWAHPLAEALDALRGQGRVAGLALHECWWREMQVLPLRTHPTMNMNHGGGFILAGTVLAPAQAK